ncbi:GlxA family transcriptional regulator [Rhodococcus pyridinivorans]|uniref:GlxA family transcriptional regulator n=1 Tax=Rhodococcus pyridinivorans TaxID=103816 RepID=UPI0020C750F6|nr:DJ-1/PfpI family protein [Rhodococcus pyridinivorans]
MIDPPYELVLCSTDPGASVASGFLVPDAGTMDELVAADTIIVPACADVRQPAPAVLVEAIRRAHDRGTRIVGLCSGAFALAEAGILDGKRATTHWMYADALASQYPGIEVDPAVLYTTDGNIFTSAGTAAAIDLCLELVRRDRGAAVVNELARRLVVPPHRAADQAQFVPVQVPLEPSTGLGPVVEWARGHLHNRITLADLADVAHVSRRTLIRRFDGEYGLTPSQWLLSERIRRAQHLLESTDLPIDRIARVRFRYTDQFAAGIRAPSAHLPQRIPGHLPARVSGDLTSPVARIYRDLASERLVHYHRGAVIWNASTQSTERVR